jgi:hypothetical protein
LAQGGLKVDAGGQVRVRLVVTNLKKDDKFDIDQIEVSDDWLPGLSQPYLVLTAC